jgi:hypothetical protein
MNDSLQILVLDDTQLRVRFFLFLTVTITLIFAGIVGLIIQILRRKNRPQWLRKIYWPTLSILSLTTLMWLFSPAILFLVAKSISKLFGFGCNLPISFFPLERELGWLEFIVLLWSLLFSSAVVLTLRKFNDRALKRR